MKRISNQSSKYSLLYYLTCTCTKSFSVLVLGVMFDVEVIFSGGDIDWSYGVWGMFNVDPLPMSQH